MSPKLSLPYYGGKSPRSRNGTNEWILGLLPPVRPRQCYVEPFAGMLGILLNRPEAPREIVNDLSGGIVDWWTAVRDHSDELARVLAATPLSRTEYLRACGGWNDPDVHLVERARRVSVVLTQSFCHILADSGWSVSHLPTSGSRQDRYSRRIVALSERMANVYLECVDASDIIERYASKSACVIYCDPPYGGHGADYKVPEFDADRASAAFTNAAARVAISGYGTDWDHLGWQRHEHHTHSSMAAGSGGQSRRTEVLWCNYDQPQQGVLFE